MGTKKGKLGTKEGNQDIALAQMLEKMKDSVNSEFCKITMGKIYGEE